MYEDAWPDGVSRNAEQALLSSEERLQQRVDELYETKLEYESRMSQMARDYADLVEELEIIKRRIIQLVAETCASSQMNTVDIDKVAAVLEGYTNVEQ